MFLIEWWYSFRGDSVLVGAFGNFGGILVTPGGRGRAIDTEWVEASNAAGPPTIHNTFHHKEGLASTKCQ